jgi:hypothetical protein
LAAQKTECHYKTEWRQQKVIDCGDCDECHCFNPFGLGRVEGLPWQGIYRLLETDSLLDYSIYQFAFAPVNLSLENF